MTWQDWLWPLVTFILGLAGSWVTVEKKHKRLLDRYDGLRVAAGKLIRAVEGDACTLGSKAINDALKFVRREMER
jgi:hypothetical protein